MRIMVFGLGLSGISASKLAIGLGHETFGVDRLPKTSLSEEFISLEKNGLKYLCEPDAGPFLDKTDLMILSPGIPNSNPLVQKALSSEIPVIGEIEWGYRNAKGKIVGITGSNGKSTTTALTAHLLKTSGKDALLGGNIGTPFCDLVSGSSENTLFVLELSSFQLENLQSFKADIAVLLNITPDHQDRYSDLGDYAEAKAHIFDRQDESCMSVLNFNDDTVKGALDKIRSRKFFFALEPHNHPGAFLRGGRVVFRDEKGKETELFSSQDLEIKGPHNIENAMAASISAILCGADVDKTGEGSTTFKALPHRLELVAKRGGVSIYNDSKATNIDSVVKALESFDNNIILLLGGKDKGADFTLLASEIKRRCRKVIAFGAASKRIEETIGKDFPVSAFTTLEEATRHALSISEEGGIVLLSPACASFDEFKNYEDRGNCFKKYVLEAEKK
jgi:UDP-N-acetylmuramoylalanine--D-glutamate ligase